jgi:hypothetical protein
MKPWRIVLLLAVIAAALGVNGAAIAHQCEENGDPAGQECQNTPPVDNWRDSYVPLFEPLDREDGDARYGYQRWHEECDNQQMCGWAEGGTSFFSPDWAPDEQYPTPNELHVGFAATHCFLFEAQHDCSDHAPGPDSSDPVHDSHGGAIFIDLCVTPNPDSSQGGGHCTNGLPDTTVGLLIVDHNSCGIFVPIASCTDEYHIWKPFDPDYTMAQMARSQAAFEALMDDPQTWLVNYFCGRPEYSEDCFLRGF